MWPPKGTNGCEITSFEPLSVKIAPKLWPVASGVLLKMEVDIRKRAWQRAWRYPAYLWSLRWVYAVKKTRRLVYGVYPRITPPPIHRRRNGRIDMLIKNPHKPCFFTHAQIRNGRIDSNQILHINSLGDVVIYLTWHWNWLRDLGGWGCENVPLPLTLALASNTANCATAHTRDVRV